MSRSHGTSFRPRVTNASWTRCHVTKFCVSAAAPRACSTPALAPRRDGGTAACGCAIRRLLRLHRAPRHSRRRRCACSATRTPQHWLAHVLTEDMLSCPARRTRSRSRRSTRRTISLTALAWLLLVLVLNMPLVAAAADSSRADALMRLHVVGCWFLLVHCQRRMAAGGGYQ